MPDSPTNHQVKGRWAFRLLIRLATVVFAVLLYWLIGFIVDDIRTVEGPRFDEFENRRVAKSDLEERERLQKALDAITQEIENERERQRVLGDSTNNLQQTITQLIDLQRLSLEKDRDLSSGQEEDFRASLSLFLENQKRYQELSRTIAERVEGKQALEQSLRGLDATIQRAREPAVAEFEQAWQRHRWKMAAWQLAVLVPLLVAGGWLVLKKRESLYFPLFLAFAGAVLVKVGVVVHEYFPRRYFRYILIAVLILAVGRMLVHFLRTVAFPRREWLLRQYREAYERFLCPVCEYPIRTGPRKFLFWTRRTVNKLVLPAGPTGTDQGGDEPYTCPSCGTELYDPCPKCGQIRHHLLPHCQHCGAENEQRRFARGAAE